MPNRLKAMKNKQKTQNRWLLMEQNCWRSINSLNQKKKFFLLLKTHKKSPGAKNMLYKYKTSKA